MSYGIIWRRRFSCAAPSQGFLRDTTLETKEFRRRTHGLNLYDRHVIEAQSRDAGEVLKLFRTRCRWGVWRVVVVSKGASEGANVCGSCDCC